MKHTRSLVFASRLTALLLLLLNSVLAQAQAPVWQTAIATGGGGSRVEATVTDASGNVYVAGGFSGTVNFGNTTLVSAGSSDIFVAKWSSTSGSFAWAQRAGGSDYDYAAALALNGSNVYVTGAFIGTAGFGTTSLTSTGSFDVFVAKLNDAGSSASFSWAQRAGGNSGDFCYAVAVNGPNVYVAGFSDSSTVALGSITLTNTSSNNGFVAKLLDAGNAVTFAWAHSFGNGFTRSPLAVTGANVYVGGAFGGTATFGGFSLTSPGTNVASGFMAKLTDAGSSSSFVWVQQASGTGSTGLTALAMSTSGALYGAGYFSGTAAFGGVGLTSVGGLDGFVTKLIDGGSTGIFAWAQRAGGPGDDQANALTVSGSTVYVAGNFSGSTATFGATSLNSSGSTDLFVARLNDVGNTSSFAWAQQAGGLGLDNATTMAVARNGVIYVGGTVIPPAFFGSQTVTGPVNSEVGFLASLTDATGLATASPTALAGLTISPNPAHALATVQLLPIPGVTTATLTLFDALGRAVRTQTAATNARTELDLTGLSAGLYALRVQAGSAIATRRLMVE